MRLIIEARIDDGAGAASGAIPLAVVERRDRSLSKLGFTLAEGRALLAEAQAALVTKQIDGWMAGERHCRRCGALLSHKDSRTVVMRTVFGNVALTSPRFLSCLCRTAAGAPRRSASPLCEALPERVTPELEYLQVKWAAYLPYRQATALLKEVLPLDKAISFSGARQKIRAVAKDLDAEIDRDIANQPCATANVPLHESANVSSVGVDSAWLNHFSTAKGRQAARDEARLRSPMAKHYIQGRHVNIVAGRATLPGRAPRVYAYVHKQVPSAAARLDQFLWRSGVKPDERVTVISDDAGEFVKAVEGSQLARGRILDWFHIAMKFKAAQNAVNGCAAIEWFERAEMEREIQGAKWLVWHGKGSQAVARIKEIDERLLARPGYESSTLWWNLCRVGGYINNNAGTLVNYGARHRRGLPISSSIAESAVNLVVSHRMAKKQQMRWTDEGAHSMVQVRVAALNGELSPARLTALAKISALHSRHICPVS